jgi:hypothetical protein
MQTITRVVKQQDYDRIVFITYSLNEVVGLNFHQGVDEVLYDWARPCPALTDIFERYSEKYFDLELETRINKSIELFQDAFIFQRQNVCLPDAQKKLIKKALEFYLNQYKTFNQVPTDTEGYEIFDLMTLQALCNYEVEIKLTEHEVENFTHANGIDLPIYN